MLEKAESMQFKANCALAYFNTPFSLLTKTDNADNKWLRLLVLILAACLLNVLILGLQCLDARSVWLLMGHDGTFLEHSTRAGQSSGSSIWRGHLHQAHSKIYVFNALIVSQASQDNF